MLQFLRNLTKPQPMIWRRVMVRPTCGGFRYVDKGGVMRDANPGDVVEIDEPTYDAVHRKVDIV